MEADCFLPTVTLCCSSKWQWRFKPDWFSTCHSCFSIHFNKARHRQNINTNNWTPCPTQNTCTQPCNSWPEYESFWLNKDQPNPISQPQTEECPVKAQWEISETANMTHTIVQSIVRVKETLKKKVKERNSNLLNSAIDTKRHPMPKCFGTLNLETRPVVYANFNRLNKFSPTIPKSWFEWQLNFKQRQ